MERETTKRIRPSGVLRQFCTFSISGRLYGVDILDVKEVNQEVSFTPIFHAPLEVTGFVNIRGRIHLILNLRRILGLKDKPLSDKNRLVLFKPVVGESFGVLVDTISDVVETDENFIEPGDLANEELDDEERGEALELISGVCRLDGSLLMIINARELLKVVDKALI